MKQTASSTVASYSGLLSRVQRSLTFRKSMKATDCGSENPTDVEARWSSRQLPTQGFKDHTFIARIGRFFRSLISNSTSVEPQEEVYKKEYLQWSKKFVSEDYEDFPEGWPQLAAFLENCDNFSIYRRFGSCHSRLLVNYMTDITAIEEQLMKLDRSDSSSSGPDGTSYRLETRLHKEGSDTAQSDLLAQLERKLNAYDDLLLKHRQLKLLEQTPDKDHENVSKWIWLEKPVREGQYDFIYRHKDFVSLVPSSNDRFEDMIKDFIASWPRSWLKKFITKKCTKAKKDKNVEYLSSKRITFTARLIVVFLAVLVLFVPVLLFLLTSMDQIMMAVVLLAFVFLFSIIVSLLPEARVMDIFVGTATYCAVLVTFLGNLQGPTG